MTSIVLLASRVRRSSGAARAASEHELAAAYNQHADQREEIVAAFMPLARSTLQPFWNVREPREDLEQVVMVGLVKALRGFDPTRSTSFAAFAYPTIRGELRRHFRDTGWAVHVPREMKQLAVSVRRLEREAGATMPDDDLAERLDVPVDRVSLARQAGAGMLSETTGADNGEPTAGSMGAEDPGYAHAEARATVQDMLEGLPPLTRTLLALRYDAGLSQRRIGELTGMSQMQVCRRLRRALDELGDRVGTDEPPAPARNASGVARR